VCVAAGIEGACYSGSIPFPISLREKSHSPQVSFCGVHFRVQAFHISSFKSACRSRGSSSLSYLEAAVLNQWAVLWHQRLGLFTVGESCMIFAALLFWLSSSNVTVLICGSLVTKSWFWSFNASSTTITNVPSPCDAAIAHRMLWRQAGIWASSLQSGLTSQAWCSFDTSEDCRKSWLIECISILPLEVIRTLSLSAECPCWSRFSLSLSLLSVHCLGPIRVAEHNLSDQNYSLSRTFHCDLMLTASDFPSSTRGCHPSWIIAWTVFQNTVMYHVQTRCERVEFDGIVGGDVNGSREAQTTILKRTLFPH
jgi:hypothetical protein